MANNLQIMRKFILQWKNNGGKLGPTIFAITLLLVHILRAPLPHVPAGLLLTSALSYGGRPIIVFLSSRFR